MTNYAQLIRATVAASNQRQRDKKFAEGGTPVGGADEFYDPYEQEAAQNAKYAAEDAEAKRRAGMSNLESVHELLSGIPRTIAGIANETPKATPEQIEQWGTLVDNPYLVKPAHVLNTLGKGLVESVKSGFLAPGEVSQGRLPIYTPDGEINPELVHRAFDTAALAGGTSAAGNLGREAARTSGPDVRLFGRKLSNDVDFDTFMQRVYGSDTRREIDDFLRTKEEPPKLLAGPQLMSDSGEAGASLGALEHAPKFYSGLERAVESIPQPKMTGAQWLGTLGGKAVKAEEMQWTGLGQYLYDRKDAPVTKAEVQEHLAGNKVELGEVNKGHVEDVTKNPRWMKADAANQALLREHDRLGMQITRGFDIMPLEEVEALTARQSKIEDEMNANHDLMREIEQGVGEGTKYHSYQLPGGENYRERLLTLPPNVDVDALRGARDANSYRIEELRSQMRGTSGSDEIRAEIRRLQNENDDFSKQIQQARETVYRSDHWDEPNILAHRRSNERSFTEPLTEEQQAAVAARREAQGQINGVVQQQHVVTRQIKDAVKPLYAARNAEIQADLKAGKISHLEAMRRIEEPGDFPELVPLQDKLQQLRAQEDAIRKAMPEEPKPKSVGSLHIEEIQSDWHQAGRKQGYKGDVDVAALERKANVGFQKLTAEIMKNQPAISKQIAEGMAMDLFEKIRDGENPGSFFTKEEKALGQQWHDDTKAYLEANSAVTGKSLVPNAPFRKNWHELALKDAIREAAETGKDRISWTPGEAQAARYDLAQHVQKITVVPTEDGGHVWWPTDTRGRAMQRIVTDKNGTVTNAGAQYGNIKGKGIDEVVGKDVADRGMAMTQEGKLEGADLKVGGEGMKGFYDKMLVDAANKIGKKHGVQVQKGEVGSTYRLVDQEGKPGQSFKSKDAAIQWLDDHPDAAQFWSLQETGHPVWYMDLSKSLKDEVLQKGFSLFTDTGKPGAALSALEKSRISTRLPTGKKNPENALADERLKIDMAAMQKDPSLFAHNVGLVAQYPNLPKKETKGKPDVVARNFINYVKGNLLHLYDQVPENIRERSKKWYEGGHKIVQDFAKEYDVDPASSAGAVAALSPQKDWFQNVDLARRVHDIHFNQRDQSYSPEMAKTAKRIFADPKFATGLKRIKGKTYGELDDIADKAMWMRLYDEAHNPRSHRLVTPEGEFGDVVRNASGAPSGTGWGSLVEIGKAIQSLEANGDVSKLSSLMGERHKVRNFYNNLIHPNSPHGDVTIDTHAVAAGLFRPLSGNSMEVAHNFGNYPGAGLPTARSSAVTGVGGTYGLYADAYREAAKERGVTPREMQSVTWEAVRGLFQDTWKSSKKNTQAVDDVWRKFQKGVISKDEARSQIATLAGGIEPPDWFGGRGPAHDEAGRHPDDQGKLPGNGVPGRSAGVDAGAGSGAAERPAALKPETAPERAAFDKWFKGSKVVDPEGKPLVVYRGEHGELPEGQQFHSRLNSLTFGSKEAANTYAEHPNDYRDAPAQASRVSPVYLQIKKPFVDNRDDPFVDLSHIEKAVGRAEAMRIAKKFAPYIEGTNNWDENFSSKYYNVADLLKKKPSELKNLYFDIWRYLDDPKEVELLKKKGYDGAIHVGSGETATDVEYRVFDPKQVKSAIRGFARGGRVKPLFDASKPYYPDKPAFDPTKPFVIAS